MGFLQFPRFPAIFHCVSRCTESKNDVFLWVSCGFLGFWQSSVALLDAPRAKMLISLETLSPTSCYAPRNQRFPGRRPKADVTFALPPVASACKHASCRRSRRRVRSRFGSDVPTTAAPPRFDRKIMAPSPDALQIAWLSAKNTK